MKKNKPLLLAFRRKREGKTDYRKRLRMLKGRKPRLVVRKSLRNLSLQLVGYEAKGDKVLVQATTLELKKLGWNAAGSNLPAAYLTGLLLAKKAKDKKLSEAVFDIGLNASIKGSRLYAALKGAVEGGIDVAHSDENLTEDDRVSGKHIAEYAKKLAAEDKDRYQKQFSAYLKNKVRPEDLPALVESVKKKIA